MRRLFESYARPGFPNVTTPGRDGGGLFYLVVQRCQAKAVLQFHLHMGAAVGGVIERGVERR